MARADMIDNEDVDWPPINPRQLLLGATVAAGIALGLSFLSWPALTLPFLGAGILAAAGAVALRPHSPQTVGWAGGIALLLAWSTSPQWDTARLVLLVLAGIALAAAALLMLPWLAGEAFLRFGPTQRHSEKFADQARQRGEGVGRAISRAIVSLLVVIHFAGILSCALSPPPPGRDPAWLANEVLSRMEPYLQFMYLTNAYHFYSPEPGPPFLLWSYVEYEDGTSRWVKVPDRGEHARDPLAQEFTRHLSLGNSVSDFVARPAISDLVKQRRFAAGQLAPGGIPLYVEGSPDVPGLEDQYLVPADQCQRLLRDYARFVAHAYPSAVNPALPVKSVKIYRVVHRILLPPEMADPNSDPVAPWTYSAYFQGEFVKPKGAADDSTPWVLEDPADPFLYWLIPIYRDFRVPMNDVPGGPPPANDFVVRNCLKVHAEMKNLQGGQP